jgi:TPR repeat protein
MHELGQGVAQDLREAADWYHKGASQGYPAAQAALHEMPSNRLRA